MAKPKRDEVERMIDSMVADKAIESITVKTADTMTTRKKKALIASKWYALMYSKSRNERLEACMALATQFDESGDWLFSIDELKSLVDSMPNQNYIDFEAIELMRSSIDQFGEGN